MFPQKISQIVAEYAASLELRSWITSKNIHLGRLMANPNVFGADLPKGFGPSTIPAEVSCEMCNCLQQNPSPIAGAWIAKNMDRVCVYYDEHLLANPSDWAGEIVMSWILGNTEDHMQKYGENPAADINWRALSSNPASWAVALLKANPELIDDEAIFANPSDFAIEYIKGRDYYYRRPLSENPHPWAIAKLASLWMERSREWSSANSSPELVDYLRDETVAGFTNPYHLAANPSIFKQKKKRVAAIAAVLSSL